MSSSQGGLPQLPYGYDSLPHCFVTLSVHFLHSSYCNMYFRLFICRLSVSHIDSVLQKGKDLVCGITNVLPHTECSARHVTLLKEFLLNQ